MSSRRSTVTSKSQRHTVWQTSVVTTAEAEDAVGELLAAQVAPRPSSYTDVETGHTIVSAYAAKPPRNLAETKRALRDGVKEIQNCGLNVGPARLTVHKLPRRNWAESWKSHFKPIEIGAQLLVKPSWIRRKPRRGQVVIVLDPGLSFGTGQHPTTEFCLRQLVARRKKSDSQSLLDVGTGSGILAIAAAKLGYNPVAAFDFDLQSVLAARANVKSNKVAKQIKLTRADLTKLPLRTTKQFDVVCANLLANLLSAGRGRLLARVKRGGVLVVAGILQREFDEVRRCYESVGWRLLASKAEREWRSGTFAKQRPG
jgi:ribosomal protein L11 methyltransferase